MSSSPSPLNVYVPLRVQAWIKNAQTTQYPATIQPSPSYSQIGNYQNDVMPDPTDWQSSRYDANGDGIYLHWTIPRGFRSGIRNEYTPDQITNEGVTSSDEVYYPFAPNRWLITRVVTSVSPQTSASWFVASDLIIPGSSVNNTTMGNAVFPLPGSNGVVDANIGCCLVFSSSWIGENGLKTMFNPSPTPTAVNLQLAGTGNPLFADYQPHCLNVFSIFDGLTGIASPATLSYSVIGWYSSDTIDPLGSGANPTIPPEVPIDYTRYTANMSNTSSDPLYMLTNLRLGLRVNVATDVGTGAPNLFTNTQLNPASNIPSLIGTTELPTLSIPGPGSNTLFHGSLYGVAWSSSTNPSSVPQILSTLGTDQIQCAIGTNGLDAMSALMNNSPPDIIAGNNQFYKEMFTAFLYGFGSSITDPNAAVMAFDDIYQNSFQPSPGGTLWRIVHRGDEAVAVPPGPQQFTAFSPALDTSVRLTTQQAEAVDALNVAQNALDVATRRMNLRLWEFFATWWQTMVTNPNPTTRAEALQNVLTAANSTSPIWGNMSPTSYIASLTDPTTGLIADLQAAVNAQIALVNQILVGNVDLELQNFADTPFWTPNDPSIVLSGLSGPQSSWPNDYLLVVQCRRDSQFLSQSFTCAGASGSNVSPAASTIQATINKIIAFPYNVTILNTDYPTIASVGVSGGTTSFVAVLQMIFSEFVLLDPANTSTLASSSYFNLNLSAFISLVNSSTSVYAVDPTAATTSGPALPSAYASAQWTSQPWAPLFALWKTRWFQTDRGLWSFNEQNTTTNRPYYSFNGSTTTLSASQIAQIEQQSVIIKGRIILTPGTNNLVKSRLLQFTNEDSDFITYCTTNNINIPTLQQQILNGINSWDIFSQTLSGFNDTLLTRASGLHLIPNGTSEVAGPYYKFMAGLATNNDATNINGVALSGFTPSADIVGQWATVPSLGNSATNPFQPVIHGQFRFHDLQIVDRFGQSVSLANDAAWSNFQAAKSEIMSLKSNNAGSATASTIAPQCAIQLPPRILQSARINASWLTSDGTNTPLKFASQGNPICGWVLINYLDRALQIYNADGLSIGELRVIQESNPPTIDWYIFNLDLANNINPYLEAFIKKMQIVIVNGTIVSTALEGMFELLDLAFGSIQTPPSYFSSYATAIVGRPLVIARASWGLELAEPLYQSWNQGAVPAQYPLSYYTGSNGFQMRIGSTNLAQDGLIGYFLDAEMLGDPTLDPAESNLELGIFYSDYYDSTDSNKPNEPGSGTYGSISGNFVPLVPYFYDDSDVSNYGSNSTSYQNALENYQNQTVYTTLLLDPFTTIHVYTQALPAATLELPSWMIRQALDNLEAVFRMGPLLVTQPLESSSTLQISEPQQAGGQWTWLSQGSDLLLPADVYTLQNPNIRPTDDPAPYTAVEGFLKLNFGDPSGSITAENELIDTADTTMPTVSFNVSPTFNFSNSVSSQIQLTAQTINGATYTLSAVENYGPGNNSSPIPVSSLTPIVNNKISTIYTPTSSSALSVSFTLTVYPPTLYNSAVPPPSYTQVLVSGQGPIVTSFTTSFPAVSLNIQGTNLSSSGCFLLTTDTMGNQTTVTVTNNPTPILITGSPISLNIQGTNLGSASISVIVTDNMGNQITIPVTGSVNASSEAIQITWTPTANMISAVFTATIYDNTGPSGNHTPAVVSAAYHTPASISSLITDSNFVIGLPTAIIAQVNGAYYDLIVTSYDSSNNPSIFEIQLGNSILGSETYDIWTPIDTAETCTVTLNVYDATYILSNPNPCVTVTSTQYNVYQVPGAVTSLTVIPSSVSVSLTWTAGTGSPTSYDVSYQITNTGNWIDFGTTTGTNATILGLLPSTSYDFAVTPSNTYGSGSNTIQTQILNVASSGGSAPAAVTDLTVGTITTTSIALSWTSVSNVSYLILYQTMGSGSWSLYSQTSQTTGTVTISNLTSAVTYDFQILALNSYGTTTNTVSNITTL